MAQSIKLGNNTYLDASGVTVDNSGTTLAKTSTTTALSSKVRYSMIGRICFLTLYGIDTTSDNLNSVSGLPKPSQYTTIALFNQNVIVAYVEYSTNSNSWVITRLAGTTYTTGYGSAVYFW